MLFRTEVLGTHRKDLLRLVLTEGPRFPAIAEFYHREVVTRGLKLMGELLRHGPRREASCRPRASPRFPQLVVAPLILAVVWDGLFAAIEPLDVKGLLDVHRQLLLRRQGEKAGMKRIAIVAGLALLAGCGRRRVVVVQPASRRRAARSHGQRRGAAGQPRLQGRRPHPEPQGRRGRQRRRGPGAGAAGEGLFRGQHRADHGAARPGQGQPAPRWWPATGRRRSRRPRPSWRSGGDARQCQDHPGARRAAAEVAPSARARPSTTPRRPIAQAEARLNSAREALRLDEAGFRNEDIDAARAQLAEREAALQVAERQLADADLIAPSRGIVLSPRARGGRHRRTPARRCYVLSLTDRRSGCAAMSRSSISAASSPAWR